MYFDSTVTPKTWIQGRAACYSKLMLHIYIYVIVVYMYSQVISFGAFGNARTYSNEKTWNEEEVMIAHKQQKCH